MIFDIFANVLSTAGFQVPILLILVRCYMKEATIGYFFLRLKISHIGGPLDLFWITASQSGYTG